MPESAHALIIRTYLDTHERILVYLLRLPEAQLIWRPPGGTLSIAWHGWHVARWADNLQASIPGMTPELTRILRPGVEIWETEGLAARWGWDGTKLGWGETGMDMADADAQQLLFPAKDELLDYVARALAQADHNVGAIDREQLESIEQWQPKTDGVWGEATVGDAVMEHITHECRHLGMMEALLGLQGQPGSATRQGQD